MRQTAVPLLVLLAVGCVRPDPAPGFTPSWEPFDPTEARWSTTDKVLLVSDCQLHNLYSQAIPERNLSSEAMVGTSIRPPQLDLFSADVLGYVLREGAPDANGILHLGDALDLACEGEFEAFLDVMAGGGKPWLMAPGNHDAYYFGVYAPDDEELWQQACYASGTPFTKVRFIRRYVAALLAQTDPGFAALADALGLSEHRGDRPEDLAERLPLEFTWRADERAAGFLKAISWKLDPDRPWRSFSVQAADVGRGMPAGDEKKAWAILLDSCQYSRQPKLAPNAWRSYPIELNCGYTGEMLPDQLRVVRDSLDRGTVHHGHVFLCHHPFGDLAPRAKASVGYLWREYGVAMMVTAHTHAGYFEHHDLGHDDDELELNMASTTDWPMEWRTLQAHIDSEGEDFFIRAERHTLADEIRHREGFFLPGWEVPVGAPDDYRGYRQGEAASGLLVDFALAHHLTPYWLPQPRLRANASARRTEEQVKDTLLWTYFRMLRYFPTDPARGEIAWPRRCRDDEQTLDRILAVAGHEDALDEKIELLRELAAFERSRHSRDAETGADTDAVRARFKISQAA